MNHKSYSLFALLGLLLFTASCKKDFLNLEPRGTDLETNYYRTEAEIYRGLVAVYDVLQWGSGPGQYAMQIGLANAASDDCYAGGSDASDQPSWVAYDNFTLNPSLGPQAAIWNNYYAGIYRANLILEKIAVAPSEVTEDFKARMIAEAKFLRAYFYFELVRYFGNIPLITNTLSTSEIYSQTQAQPSAVYAQIEQDLRDARNTPQLPETVGGAELGRITKGAVTALLGKVILYQNDDSRMLEAADLFEEVINGGIYALEPSFANIFSPNNEFGRESVFEIQFSGNQSGGWENFPNGTEGNLNVQFFGMRDYIGNTFSAGWGFCPVTPDLVQVLQGDPRFQHTIIDGNLLQSQGASYAPSFQNTNYFIRKYAPLAAQRATVGEPALNWGQNVIVIRLADVLLMCAEAIVRGNGNQAMAQTYMNRVRSRAGIQPYPPTSGQDLLDKIYLERRKELATEGHRFFDLVRTNQASNVLGSQGFVANKNELLPIPQIEIDLSQNTLRQNLGYN
jgi:hypothetical protein